MQVARALLCVALLIGCSRSDETRPRIELGGRSLAVPAPDDVGRACSDVADTRVCWGPGPSDVRRVERARRPATDRGLRCAGHGPAQRCEDRRFSADAFACNDAQCTQRHPRMPDDGEWECADLDGVVVCRGWAEAAGVVPGPPDLGWHCGPRAGAKSERICVDFAPDRPPHEPWSCRFQYESDAPPRLCTRGGAGPLGRECAGGCPFGSVCVAERCLPLEPQPKCWVDKDCAAGQKCAHGTCREVPR